MSLGAREVALLETMEVVIDYDLLYVFVAVTISAYNQRFTTRRLRRLGIRVI